MLRILGSPKKLCGGMTRRDWLRVGGLGLAGLTLPDVLRLQQAAAGEGKEREPGFGRAKAIILIHLYGSPSQLEWVDPKPEAPVEIRGEFGVIPSSLPGCQVCDLFPNMAKVMDRVTVLRSLTHPYPLHGVAFALTGARFAAVLRWAGVASPLATAPVALRCGRRVLLLPLPFAFCAASSGIASSRE